DVRFKPLWLDELVTLARDMLHTPVRTERLGKKPANSQQPIPKSKKDPPRKQFVTSSRFLKACRREAVDATPVWFMRQAGRYMQEYRALRTQYSLLDIFPTPALATRGTLQPVRRIDV